MTHTVRLDKSHRYWIPSPIGEVEVPGFTAVCRAQGIIEDNPHYTEDGRARGVALHKWLRFLVTGRTPKDAPDQRIVGKVEGIRKFLSDSGFKFAGGEEPVYDPDTGVACSPDLWGFIGNWFYVIDAKSGGKQPYHALQTSCQALALTANGFRIQKRAGLYLRDGGYKLIEHDNPSDLGRWKYIAHQYRKNN